MVAIDVIARDKASKKFDQIGKSAQSAADKMGSISKKSVAAGKTMTKKVTLPLLAVGAGAVKAADDVGKAMDDIKVATGASGDTLSGLQGVAKNIAKKIPVDIGVIASSIGDLNTLTGATGPVLQDMTTKVLEASRVLGEDGAANAAAFGQTLNAANIPAKDAGKLLDTLFAASQQYGVGMGDMMKQLKMFGPQMSNAGLSMADTVAIFGQFNKAGVSAQRIVPTLNPALLKWAKAGEDPQKMLAGLSDKIAKATTDQEAMSLAAQHFSGPGATAFVNAIRKGGVSLSDLDKSLDTSSVNILKTGKSTRTMGENLTVLKNKAVLALVPIGQKILPVIITVFGKVGDVITKVTDWWGGLSDTTKKFLTIALGVVAAIGPALTIFGKLLAVGLKVGKMIKVVRTAMIAMNAAMAANPILIVVAAVAALVAGFIYLWNNCEGFRDFWIGLWNGIKAVVGAVVDWFMDNIVSFFTETLPGMFSTVIDWLKDNWPLLLAIITGPIGIAVGVIVKYWDQIKAAFQAVWGWVKSVFKGLWSGFQAIIIDPIKAAFGWIRDKFIAPVQTALSTAWETIKGAAQSGWAAIKKVVIDPIKALAEWLAGTWGKIHDAAKTAWETVKSLATSVWGGIKTAVKAPIDAVKSFLSGTWGSIKDTAQAAWGLVRRFVVDPIEAAQRTLSSTVGKIKDGLAGAWESVKGAAKSAWGFVHDYIVDPIESAWGWIQQLVGKIGGALGSALDNAIGFFKRPINALIDGINWVIRQLNNISVSIPSWVPFVGGNHFGIDLPTIPPLARGGMTTGPMQALIGDNPSGREAVLPLDSPRTTAALSKALGRVRGDAGPRSAVIVMELDGRVIGRVVAPIIAGEIRVKAGPAR